jgi:hypothetical protein
MLSVRDCRSPGGEPAAPSSALSDVDTAALQAAIAAACSKPGAAAADGDEAGAAVAPRPSSSLPLLVVEDGLALCDACGSVSEGVRLLRTLFKAASEARRNHQGPSVSAPSSASAAGLLASPAAQQLPPPLRLLLRLNASPGTERLQVRDASGGVGINVVPYLASLAASRVTVEPLAGAGAGFRSRDVAGRVTIAPPPPPLPEHASSASGVASVPAAGTSAATAADALSATALVRIGSDGRWRTEGALVY